jgi:hypothetical protein
MEPRDGTTGFWHEHHEFIRDPIIYNCNAAGGSDNSDSPDTIAGSAGYCSCAPDHRLVPRACDFK